MVGKWRGTRGGPTQLRGATRAASAALGAAQCTDKQVHLAAHDAAFLSAAVEQYLGATRRALSVKHDDGAFAAGARRASGAMEQLKCVVIRGVY